MLEESLDSDCKLNLLFVTKAPLFNGKELNIL